MSTGERVTPRGHEDGWTRAQSCCCSLAVQKVHQHPDPPILQELLWLLTSRPSLSLKQSTTSPPPSLSDLLHVATPSPAQMLRLDPLGCSLCPPHLHPALKLGPSPAQEPELILSLLLPQTLLLRTAFHSGFRSLSFIYYYYYYYYCFIILLPDIFKFFFTSFSCWMFALTCLFLPLVFILRRP